MTTTSKQISMKDFYVEVRADLPNLFKEYPTGIALSFLSTWYGESPQRIAAVCKKLQAAGKLIIHRKFNRSTYILPPEGLPASLMTELTKAQRELVNFIAQYIAKNNGYTTVSTNYAQLSRALNSSYGGMIIRVERCVELGYLKIVQPSKPGKRDQLLIALGENYPTSPHGE